MWVGNNHASALFLQILTDNRCTQRAFDERKAGNHHPPICHLCSVIPCSSSKVFPWILPGLFHKTQQPPHEMQSSMSPQLVSLFMSGRKCVTQIFHLTRWKWGVNCGKIVKLIKYVPTTKHPDYVWKHFLKHSRIYPRYRPCQHWAVGMLYGIYGAKAGSSVRRSSAGRAQQMSTASAMRERPCSCCR